jgi:hypothetical protein
VLFLLLGGQTVLAGFYFGLMNLVAERRTQHLSSVGQAMGSLVLEKKVQKPLDKDKVNE